MPLTEDIPYNVDEFATAEPEKKTDDPEQPNKPVLIEVSEYLALCLESDKLTSSLDLSANCPLSLKEQVFISQRDNARLQTAKNFVDNKIKELK